MKMKLDYNNLINLICETIEKSEDEEVKEQVFGIEIGLNLLTSYLSDIAKLAIKRNDEELLELCCGLLIVKKTEGGASDEQM